MPLNASNMPNMQQAHRSLITPVLNVVYGKQLGQARPANTTAVSIYSPDTGMVVRVLNVMACNTTGGAVTFRLFHDNDGTTYDETTALYFDAALAANTTVLLDVNLFMANPAGNLAVRTSSNSAITFTVYGEEYVR